MNKYLLLVLIPLLLSCENIFHEEDNEYILLDKYSEKIEMVNGIYANLVKIHNNCYCAMIIRSDDVNSYSNFSGPSCRLTWDDNLTNAPGYIYQKTYTAIIAANSLLNWVNEDNHPELLGEIYFLRAYSYFILARFFGDPPLITDIEVNYTIEKPSYLEVYEFIISDLTQAMNLLPDTYTNARIPHETPHKGTVKALLAEVYLSMAGFPIHDKSKYEQAALLAGEVIENAEFYGYALLDDFADLWKEDNRYNNENIFGLFYTYNDDAVTLHVNSKKYIFYYAGSSIISDAGFQPEMGYFVSYPNSYRKHMSMMTGRYIDTEIELLDTAITGIFFEMVDPVNNPCSYPGSTKSFKRLYLNDRRDRGPLGPIRGDTENTLYLLRYAQTLLTYAEAKGRLDQVDESALDAVNKIRRRAHRLDINSPSPYDLKHDLANEQFTDSVVKERGWELFFEPNGKWFDVVRLELKDELWENRYAFDFPNKVEWPFLKSNWYLYAIPQEDRWLNPNLEEGE